MVSRTLLETGQTNGLTMIFGFGISGGSDQVEFFDGN